MRIGLTGQTAAPKVLNRFGLAAAGILMAIGLGACTTVEGANAMGDFGTFEREVMSSTARGFGLIPGQTPKDSIETARAPLALPASGQALPTPTTATASAQLPVNSDTVRLDTTNLSQADIQRLRNAKVVDLHTLSGRPLTEAEARQLTARMQAANMQVSANTSRPLYLPPEEYFTRVGDAQLVCSTPSGEVVAISDPKCPDAVRKAIRAANARDLGTGGALSTGQKLTEAETTLD